MPRSQQAPTATRRPKGRREAPSIERETCGGARDLTPCAPPEGGALHLASVVGVACGEGAANDAFFCGKHTLSVSISASSASHMVQVP